MKPTLTIISLALALSTASLRGAEPGVAPVSVEQQFRDADVSIAIEQYKRLKAAAFELELRVKLEEFTDEQRTKLQERAANLERQAMSLREQVEKRASLASVAGN
jgi:hypothetical protein